VVASIVRLLRLASVAICLIVIASFALFAISETKSASGRQQEALQSGGPAATTTTGSHSSSSPPKHESAVHEAIDEASSKLTSPFSGVLSSSSEWATRGGKLLLALLVYGFGLGYLARMLRVRV
jgi:hypothetical protein